jgi:hypothetical protein
MVVGIESSAYGEPIKSTPDANSATRVRVLAQ